jgi:hypothetical protein
VKHACYISWSGPIGAKLNSELHCEQCGELGHYPTESPAAAPRLDLTVGMAVLAATALGAAFLFV